MTIYTDNLVWRRREESAFFTEERGWPGLDVVENATNTGGASAR